jgi:hypothetical protein
MFTSDMQEIKKLGLLAPDSISWTVYPPDLRIITELLPSPSEFWHYFRWRRSLIGLNNVFGTDEVDWLGIYLQQGPGEESLAPESYQLTFSSYTTEMDDYFLHQSGERSKPAKRPERQIPPRMRALIRDMEDSRFMIFGTDPNWLAQLSKRSDSKITMISIPAASVVSIKQELRDAGVTESVVFPDLDGLGRELKQKWNARR